MSDSNTTTTNNSASLIGGHAKYVQGATESAIGSVTGSESWSTSGEKLKSDAVNEMKKAGENRDTSSGFGAAEEKLGAAVGCEGMVEEGKESKQ